MGDSFYICNLYLLVFHLFHLAVLKSILHKPAFSIITLIGGLGEFVIGGICDGRGSFSTLSTLASKC